MASLAAGPIPLEANPIAHFYRGGGAVSSFRRRQPGPHPAPEDWVGSTTSRFGQSPAGLSRLADGRLLVAAVEADPLGFLGPDHLAAFGADVCLLVKLLDAAERLIVHCHPDRAFAAAHLGCVHGKTEAWIVLSEGPGEVFLGFKRPVPARQLAGWVAGQRVEELLGALNRLEVTRGSALLVPAGVPHAIGPGVLVLELQEPTDFSIALEQRDLLAPELGLGWPLALTAVDCSAWPAERLAALGGPGLGSGRSTRQVLGDAADPFFRAELVVGSDDGVLEAGFSVLVVIEGSGQLVTESGMSMAISAGSTLLLPFAAGRGRVDGDVALLACRPPRPGPLQPARPLSVPVGRG